MKAFITKFFFPLTVALLAFAMLLTYWFGIEPFLRKITEKREEIQKFYTARENRNRQINSLTDLRRQHESIVADERYLDILFTDDRIVDFIKTLEGLAQETKVEIAISSKDGTGKIFEKKPVKEKAPKAPDKENDQIAKDPKKVLILDELPYDRYLVLSVQATGSYENLVSFLQKMETLPIALDVVRVTIEPKGEETNVQARPLDTGVNPFLLTPGANVTESTFAPLPALSTELHGTFETVLYVDKKKE